MSSMPSKRPWRENARSRAPFVFRNHTDRLETLVPSFRAALMAIQQAQDVDEVLPEVREAFGLTTRSIEADPTSFPGARTDESEDETDTFASLRQAVSVTGEQSAEQRIEDLVSEFSKLVAPLRDNGILSEEDVRKLGIRLNSTISVIPLVEATAPALTPGSPSDPRIVNRSDVLLDSVLSDVGTLGAEKTWNFYPELLQIQSPVKQWLRTQIEPTLVYDAAATRARQTAAEEAVADVIDDYVAGDTLLAPRERITADKLALLDAQYRQSEADAGAGERLIRVAVVFAMLVVLAFLNGFYIIRNEPQLVTSASRLTVYLLSIVLAITLGRIMSYDPLRAEVIPLAATVMIFAIAYNQVLAALTALTVSLVVTLATTAELSQFVVLMSTATTAVLPLSRVSSRTTLIKSGFLAGVTYFLVWCGIHIIQSQSVTFVLQDAPLWIQGLKGAGLCLLTGYLVAGSLPFIESTFGVVTGISLLEMSDPSHPLLQELVRRAPGTYNHSISVASIGEAAAEAIDANGLLVRIGAYFHDIGKMLKPQYFIENVEAGTRSRHEHLAPAMSTLIIIGHVKDGVDLAEQYNLPGQLIDFIEQHHGTTLVEYFYHEAARQAGESPDHKSNAEESTFRYPGPKPQTREAGVMMLADAVESASRTLSDPTPKRLETLVHDISMKRLLDGQFEECALTLSELRKVEKSLVKSLIGIYHGRIKYPEARTA